MNKNEIYFSVAILPVILLFAVETVTFWIPLAAIVIMLVLFVSREISSIKNKSN